MHVYLQNVCEGRLPLNHDIMNIIQNIFNLLPNLKRETLVSSFNVKVRGRVKESGKAMREKDFFFFFFFSPSSDLSSFLFLSLSFLFFPFFPLLFFSFLFSFFRPTICCWCYILAP